MFRTNAQFDPLNNRMTVTQRAVRLFNRLSRWRPVKEIYINKYKYIFFYININALYFFDFCINRLNVLESLVLLILAFCGLKRESLKLVLAVPFIKLGLSQYHI